MNKFLALQIGQCSAQLVGIHYQCYQVQSVLVILKVSTHLENMNIIL